MTIKRSDVGRTRGESRDNAKGQNGLIARQLRFLIFEMKMCQTTRHVACGRWHVCDEELRGACICVVG